MSLSLGIGLGLTMQQQGGLSAYAAAGFEPAIYHDYSRNLFRKAGVAVPHDDLMLHTATSLGTLTDSDGLLKWRAHNLFLNSAVAVTQDVTVTSGADHTLAFKGTGSITYSGAASGTLNGTGANDLVVVEVATTTGTLTCTVTGSVTVCRVYRSDLAGVQANPDTTSDPTYVATGGSAVYKRRNNYVNGVRHCLVEPEAATNMLTFSSELDNAAWIKKEVNITTNAIVGPDGVSTAEKMFQNAAPSTSHRIYQPITPSAGNAYTGSMYLKAAEDSWVQFYFGNSSFSDNKFANFDLTNGLVGNTSASVTAQIKDAGNGWYRCSMTLTSNATAGGNFFIILTDDIDVVAASPQFTGDGVSGVYLWGAQFEESSVASSYIPTSGSTVTRALETLVIPAANLASVVNTDAMSIALSGLMSYGDDGSVAVISYLWEADTNNRIRAFVGTDASRIGQPQFNQKVGGVIDSVLGSESYYTPDINVPFNISSRHGSTFINGATDGAALTANTTPTSLVDLSTVDFEVAGTGIHNIGLGRLWGVDITDAGIEEASA